MRNLGFSSSRISCQVFQKVIEAVDLVHLDTRRDMVYIFMWNVNLIGLFAQLVVMIF